jgi:FKBP-type peptidyl-prolyl cis-trans isomerase
MPRFALALALIAALAGCAGVDPTLANQPAPSASTDVTTPTGLKYAILTPGKAGAAVAKAGDTVSVHYTGWLTSGKQFDSSLTRGKPFSFKLGAGQVIPGWDQGVAGMKVGEKRKLVIPGDLAYGAAGTDGIPANATLIFTVELIAIT